jgi:hypothetical protein
VADLRTDSAGGAAAGALGAVLPGMLGAAAGGVCAVAVSQNTLRQALTHASAQVDDPTVHELERIVAIGLAEGEDLLIAPLPSASRQHERAERLVQMLMPDSIPQPVELLQARRSAAMRRDMLARYGYYSAEELADLNGSKARNRYALAARWMREGRIFGVPLGARSVFPAFQFDADGSPYPIVAQALTALPRERMSPWSVALWWYASSAWLPAQARPAELIGGPEQERIVQAAQRLSEPEPL